MRSPEPIYSEEDANEILRMAVRIAGRGKIARQELANTSRLSRPYKEKR